MLCFSLINNIDQGGLFFRDSVFSNFGWTTQTFFQHLPRSTLYLNHLYIMSSVYYPLEEKRIPHFIPSFQVPSNARAYVLILTLDVFHRSNSLRLFKFPSEIVFNDRWQFFALCSFACKI